MADFGRTPTIERISVLSPDIATADAGYRVGIGDQKADLSSGGAAIFERTGTTWRQQAYLKASNPGQDDWFGVRLVVSGAPGLA